MSTPKKRRKKTTTSKRLRVVPSPQANIETDLPDWVTITPEETIYELAMWNDYDAQIQLVGLSRDEFIALKQHLARLRGISSKGIAA